MTEMAHQRGRWLWRWPVDNDEAHAEAVIAGICMLSRLLFTPIFWITQAFPLPPRWPLAAALGVAAVDSLVTVVAIGWRWQRSRGPSVPRWLGPATAVGTSLGLTLQALSLPVTSLAYSTFWMQQYAVFSCVIIAACARQRMVVVWVGVITVSYGLSVLVAVRSAAAVMSAGETAAVWANALAFPGFAAVAAVMMRFLRETARLAARLRSEAAASRAEKDRIRLRSAAHRQAHDIGKAFLRELVAGRIERAALGGLASYSRDLLAALDLSTLDSDHRRDLRQAIAEVALPFKKVNPLVRAELSGLVRPTSGVPMVFVEAIREALNNARYHAPGSSVLLTARTTDVCLEASVRDEGPGCNPEQVSARWQAKRSTFWELGEAGGSWEIHSDGPGTTVVLRYPLPA